MTSSPSRRPSLPPGMQERFDELHVSNAWGPWMSARGRGRLRASGATPTTTDELADWLGDHGQRLLTSGGAAGAQTVADTIAGYIDAARSDGSIQAQVQEQVQAGLAEFAKDNGVDGRLPLGAGITPQSARSVRSALNHPQAVGAAANGLFTDLPEYLRAIQPGNQDAPTEKLRQLQNVGSTVPSEGGYLIPEQLRSQLLHVSLETSIVRPRATVIPVSTLRTPVPTIDSTSNVSSVFGGVTGHWTEEGAPLVASEPAFARVVLEAKKLAVYADIPNELWADSLVSLPAIVDMIFGAALSHFEDTAFLNGGGVGEPLGVLNSAAAVSVTRDAASRVKWVDIASMYARLLPSSMSRAVWIVSPAVLSELAQLVIPVRNDADTDSVGGASALVTNGSADLPLSILGRPVVVSEKVPTLGTAGDVTLVDLGFYLIGDRMSMTTKVSEHFRFQTDETSVRIIERVDGRLWLQSAITPANSGATLSPVVKLS